MPQYSTPRYAVPRSPKTNLPSRRVPPQITPEGQAILDQLIAARMAAGLSQLQLAAKMGISSGTLGSLECGRHLNGPTITVLVRYAQAVGLASIAIPAE